MKNREITFVLYEKINMVYTNNTISVKSRQRAAGSAIRIDNTYQISYL